MEIGTICGVRVHYPNLWWDRMPLMDDNAVFRTLILQFWGSAYDNVVGHQKTESFAGVEDASDVIRADGAIIRQSSASKDSGENLPRGGPR
jgi:hypothetical protein